MVRKKIKIAISVFTTLIIVFLVAYTIMTIEFNKTDSNNKTTPYVPEAASQSVVTNSSSVIKVGTNTKVTLKVKYLRSGNVTSAEISNVELIGKTKEEVDTIYKIQGYAIDLFNEAEVVLSKSVDKYSDSKYIPGKYVLGIKDDNVAIFKSNDQGELYIEDSANDITNIKTKNLKKADIDILNSGDLQFATKEDAEGGLEDYR